MINVNPSPVPVMPRKKTSTVNYLGKDGLIYNIYFGNQTGVTVKKIGKELAVLISKVHSQHKQALLLTDITDLGEVNLAARKVGLGIMQNLEYDRCAITGCNFITAGLVKLMITASGRGFKIRVFENKKEAREWLLQK